MHRMSTKSLAENSFRKIIATREKKTERRGRAPYATVRVEIDKSIWEVDTRSNRGWDRLVLPCATYSTRLTCLLCLTA
jgi:hypothetical protein